MGKNPAMQWYVKDWLTDVQLRMASPDVRGIWADALCLMWVAPERGRLVVEKAELARVLCNGDVTLCNKFVTQIQRYGFGDYEERSDGTVVIVNRRMDREFRQQANTRDRVRRFREKGASGGGNADVTAPSPYPSPESPKTAYPPNPLSGAANGAAGDGQGEAGRSPSGEKTGEPRTEEAERIVEALYGRVGALGPEAKRFLPAVYKAAKFVREGRLHIDRILTIARDCRDDADAGRLTKPRGVVFAALVNGAAGA